MALPLIFLGSLGAAWACSSTLPSVQVLAQLNTANPPVFQPFNIPLFDNDCAYLIPANPIPTDGRFVPSTAFGVRFSNESFVDPTGNALDQASLSNFVNSVDAFARLTGIEVHNQKSIFDAGLVSCTVTLRGGEKQIFGGLGFASSGVDFGHQISVDSYQCCIDYNGNNCT